MTPRFCVESGSLFFEDVSSLNGAVERFNDLIASLLETDDQKVCCDSDIYEVMITDGVRFEQLLYQEEINEAPNSLERDNRIRLGLFIDRFAKWQDLGFESKGESFIHDGTSFQSKDIEFSIWHIQKARATALLLLNESRFSEGEHTFNANSGAIRIFCLTTERLLKKFYRTIYEVEHITRERFMEFIPLAFPRLRFKENIATELKLFSRSFEELRSDLIKHLSMLNDDFIECALRHNFTPAKITSELESSTGISTTPESPNTHKNKEAMSKRKVVEDDNRFYNAPNREKRENEHYCEWHTKLSPQVDRIYFKFFNNTDLKFVLIGFFHEHLPT